MIDFHCHLLANRHARDWFETAAHYGIDCFLSMTPLEEVVGLLRDWGQESPTVVVAAEDEETLIKSFRNLDKVLVTVPAELEVAHVVWARSLVVSEAALPLVQGRAS